MAKQNQHFLDERKFIKITINHQSKQGYSQKNKKEQSTCAKQKEKISCQTENKTNAPRCCMYLGDEKKNKNSYLLAMVGCPNVAYLPCPQNNPQKEWKEQSTCAKSKNNQPTFSGWCGKKHWNQKQPSTAASPGWWCIKNKKQQLSNN